MYEESRKQFESYEIAFRYARGNEIGSEEQKDRPCVILSRHGRMVTYAPLVTYREKYQRYLEWWPSYYVITYSSGRKAVVLLDQIDSMDISQIDKYCNGTYHLASSEIAEVQRKIIENINGSAYTLDREPAI